MSNIQSLIQQTRSQIIAPALKMLPASMTSSKSEVMLIAIGLQESELTYRHQVGGPAHGLWQFEKGGGVKGVMTHKASAGYAKEVLNKLPMEFAVEAQKLLEISLEGSVG